MKKFVIVFALVAFACAAPLTEEEEEKKDLISIVQSDRNQNEDGSYTFGYQASDGTAREETANIENENTDDAALTVSGSYSYIDSNGEEVVVHYTAGKNGFVPVGSHIPKEISEVAEAAKDLPNVYDSDPNEDLRAPKQSVF